jgi:two-component system, OmpR family, alkaline phosphatase synthesis response regulator PhoP
MNGKKTVLIIDDDRDFVTAIESLLQYSGYQVRSAFDGREGLRLAKTIQPDLILLDVMMTERTEGFFMLQEARRIPELSQTPVIVISSIYADQPIFRVSPEAGWLPANLFLPKPVDPARLLAEVRRLTETASLQISHSTAGRRES